MINQESRNAKRNTGNTGIAETVHFDSRESINLTFWGMLLKISGNVPKDSGGMLLKILGNVSQDSGEYYNK